MFTFFLQTADLIHYQSIGLFFVFFILTWSLYAFKLLKARKFIPPVKGNFGGKVHIIIPVVDEDIALWRRVLLNLTEALQGLEHTITVVGNGGNGQKEGEIARELGIETKFLSMASKRKAIFYGINNNSDITIILDSDTIVHKDSIKELLSVFGDKEIGGATPRHIIFNRDGSYIRRICDWLEDIRFNEVLKVQGNYISCLPGRMLAIRTPLLMSNIGELMTQKFLGKECISGDDRFLTSRLLEADYKTVYVPTAIVHTNSPDTLSQFIKQRLRWSRTSFRESVLSIGWLGKYPVTFLTVYSNIFFRWFFFVIILFAVFEWFEIIQRSHYIYLPKWQMILFTALGFLLSGFVRQLRHILSYPRDIVYLIPFLLVTTFILTPVEWFGNLSVRESNWLTRKVEG